MASLGTGTMTIEFSPQARRQLDRLTKAIENLAKEKGGVTIYNHPEKVPPREFYRDAETGRVVTKEYAQQNPETTIKETY